MNEDTKSIIRIVAYPLVLIHRKIEEWRISYLRKHNLHGLADYYMKAQFGKMDWENPTTLNEKIQWLKFYGDTSLWSDLSDKYKVREYVEQKGLQDCLVKLYGHWDRIEDVEWECLPEKFVLKVNNGSGDVLVCHDKSKLNIPELTAKYNALLNKKFGYLFAEPHYDLIKPCIIVEELLDIKKQPIETDTLIDYKIWCFDGKPAYIWTCYNRRPRSVEVGTYDLEWNYLPEKSVFTSHYKKASMILPKPKSLTRMLEIASKLSEGFPELRVDLYEVDGKPYFGELTFTSQGGYMPFYTPEFQLELGNLIKLPKKNV